MVATIMCAGSVSGLGIQAVGHHALVLACSCILPVLLTCCAYDSGDKGHGQWMLQPCVLICRALCTAVVGCVYWLGSGWDVSSVCGLPFWHALGLAGPLY